METASSNLVFIYSKSSAKSAGCPHRRRRRSTAALQDTQPTVEAQNSPRDSVASRVLQKPSAQATSSSIAYLPYLPCHPHTHEGREFPPEENVASWRQTRRRLEVIPSSLNRRPEERLRGCHTNTTSCLASVHTDCPKYPDPCRACVAVGHDIVCLHRRRKLVECSSSTEVDMRAT